MIRYVIALKELGLKNDNIISLLKEHPADIIEMFNSNDIFKKRFELLQYEEKFHYKDVVDDALSKADSILENNNKFGIKATYYTAETYPKELSQINNPPVIIYYKGAEFQEISSKAIACVGTRKPTKLSYNAVNYLIPQLVNEECSIISGLAFGVDRLSHQACISASGKTVAVVAHGLDYIYPKENKELAYRILQTGGIIMSEYPVGTKPDKYRFVNRNRLIVGMSRAIIIFECDVKGGTMHNVDFANQQHKSIFCPALGNDVLDIQSGTKMLLDEKLAIKIREGRDILGILKSLGCEVSHKRMTNREIKDIYLQALLCNLNSSEVIKKTIQDLSLTIDFKTFKDQVIQLISEQQLDVDLLINTLVQNNIQDINNTHEFIG